MLKILTKAANLHGGMGRLFCLLLVAVVLIPTWLIVSPVSAEGPPGTPAVFSGSVTISGSPAAVGTIIQAQVNSVVCSTPCTVITAGSYPNLLVTCGNYGDTVQFYVNSIAAQTAVLHPGEYNRIDLSIGGGGSAPAAPVLSSPTSGATGVSTVPTLQWSASTGATSYAAQVSTSSSFGTIAFSQSGIAGLSITVSPALSAGTLYYWRANATNSNGTSAWTTAWSFTTASVAPPTAPTLLSPSNGATGVSNSPMLQWNSSTGATSYNVQVSTSSAFTTFVFTQSGSATAATVTPALSNSTTYYWRANATGSGGTSSWSSTWSFTTGGGSTPSVPAFFKGVAYKNGSPVYLKQVCATVNSSPSCASSDSLGNYLVSASGNSGDTVTFTVDGSTATETATYSPGWMTTLNLHAGTGVLAVTTASGNYVSSTTATLSGTLVSLSSLDTSATPSIDYGPTTAYEWGTWTMSSMSSPGTFTTPAIGGLTAGQVIHFRAKAMGNSTGTTAYGLDATYTHALPGSLSIVTTSLPGGTVGTAYSSSPELRATGGTSPYTWAVASGSLPSWATLTPSTGLITGTPSAAGTSSFTVRVTDAASATATSGSLTITSSIPGSLAVVTTSLPSGTVGTSYTATLTATGGTSPYTWAVASGSLPSWATLTPSTGLITGTPDAAGTSSLTVSVTDAASATATSGSLTIVIGTSPTGTEIVGSTTDACAINVMGGALWLYKCQASGSNTITNMNVKVSFPGHVKVAIYADNAGAVGSLIVANNTATAVTNNATTPPSAKVNQVPLSTSITSGSYYWLAVVSDTDTVGGTRVAGTTLYQTISTSFADYTFPATVTGYTTSFNGRLLLAGAY